MVGSPSGTRPLLLTKRKRNAGDPRRSAAALQVRSGQLVHLFVGQGVDGPGLAAVGPLPPDEQGDEHGDVEYAITREEWQQLRES